MRPLRLAIGGWWLLGSVVIAGAAAQEDEEDGSLLTRAEAQYREGLHAAIRLATTMIEQGVKVGEAYRRRAAAYEGLGEFASALADLDHALALEPNDADLLQRRGEVHFKAGHIRESIGEFDRYLKLRPDQESHHWQRGICYYYAGEYAKGARQFTIHRTVNPQDVENAVWHYLCQARLVGVERACSALIEIDRDDRPWAMPVYRMFQGRLTPEEVLKQAELDRGSDVRRQDNLFYTHFYVGLFHEAAGAHELARKHIEIAVTRYPSSHYMGHVARVHLQR